EVPPWWRLIPGELSARVALDPSGRTGAVYARLHPDSDNADSDGKGDAPTTSSAEGGHRGVRGVVPPGEAGVAPDTMAPFAIGRESGGVRGVVPPGEAGVAPDTMASFAIGRNAST